MKNVAEELRQVLAESSEALARLSEKECGERTAPDKWSKKEVLGHLIDSASNNHQRFVRAQLIPELKLAGYEQEGWVQTQGYHDESWTELVQFWKFYNLHLVHLIGTIPEAVIHNRIVIGDNEPVTLEFVVQDYVRHLKHHLKQILG